MVEASRLEERNGEEAGEGIFRLHSFAGVVGVDYGLIESAN